ncbi:MAG: archaeosortase/exosortase family protein [Proteobacteria bacterium]|nr:archaeosortase/exosortase family protein [Pseudomonadota bacterium]
MTTEATPFPVRWLAWFFLPSLVIAHRTVLEMAKVGWDDDRYNYTLASLAVALVLLYQEWDFLFPPRLQQDKSGLWLAVSGLAANLVLTYAVPGVDLFWRGVALSLVWIGGLWYCHGTLSLRKGAFQVLLLLFAVPPVPQAWMHRFEVFLQHSSANLSELIFRLIGQTMFRDGLIFQLPGLNIEVATECSGIRSTTALILVVAVCAHLLLQTGRSKLILLLLAIPAGILKNAVRIVILGWLGSNLSPSYLDSPLHRQGGPLFTLTAVAVLGPALWWLMRREAAASSPATRVQP